MRLLLIFLPSLLFSQIEILDLDDWVGAQAVIIHTRDVNCEVLPSSNDRIQVEFDYSQPARSLTWTMDQNQLLLSIQLEPGRKDPEGRLSVRIPGEAELQVYASSGRVIVRNLNKISQIQTQTGSISMEATRGQIRLLSVSGDISLREHAGDFWAQSVSGNILLDSMAPTARGDAQTASGNVYLGLTIPRNQVQLTAGTLHTELVLYGQAYRSLQRLGTGEVRVRAVSSSGRVEVRAP